MSLSSTRITRFLSSSLLAAASACVITDGDQSDTGGSDPGSTEADSTATSGVDTSTGQDQESDSDTGDDPIVYGCGDVLPETLSNTPREVDYVFTCSFTVLETLIVEFGTVIEVDPGLEISVDGGMLVLKGTAADPVVIRASDPAQPWGGLRFFGPQTSRLDFARIETAGALTPIGSAAILVGAESFGEGHVSIRDCVIEGSQYYGIEVNLGVLEAFERNVLRENAIAAQLSVDTVGMLGSDTLFEANKSDSVVVVGLITPNVEPKTWNRLAGPYQILDNVTLGGTNTIEAGVTIVMDGTYATLASGAGAIIAVGSAESPIEFVDRDDQIWNSVFLSTPGNRFEFVNFRGGSGAGNPFDQAGMVTLDANTESTVEIRDCVFEGSTGWGVWLGNSGFNDDIDTANQFIDNALGDIRFP